MQNYNDDFDPEDHGIENDEIAKIYAEADMKDEKLRWIEKRAEEHYEDFKNLSVSGAIQRINDLISSDSISSDSARIFLDNLIKVFSEKEEYEKCSICLKIKNGIND